MYNTGFNYGNAAASFSNAPQQQGGQPGQQQMMYNQQTQQMPQQQQQQPQQQQQQQPPQQQQFGGMPPQGFNPQMMAGNPGMMQNVAAMQQMAANGQMAGFQQQFPGGPYGQAGPSPVGHQGFMPNNYMMAGGMPQFPMNHAQMTQQQQAQIMQRMQQQQQHQHQQHQHQQQHQQQQHQQQQHQQQQHQQQQHQPHQQPHQQHQQQLQQQQQGNPAMTQASTPQRPPSAPQGTPTNSVPPQQPQFATPQPPSQTQTPNSMQPQGVMGATPQTPTSPNQNAGNVVNAKTKGPPTAEAPMSPTGDQSREKQRFALLLDINHELLYESIQIRTTQQEVEKEWAAQGNTGERKPTEDDNALQQDYFQCMRRLQANLTYMAALADRKPDVKVPPCPTYLSAPPLHLAVKLKTQPVLPEGVEDKVDLATDREARDKSIKDLYSRLQAVFPGFDPKKEHPFGAAKTGPRAPNPAANQASPTAASRPPQVTPVPAPVPGA